MIEGLAAALRSIAPAGVSVGVRSIDDADVAGLLPAEVAHAASFSAMRRREFGTGRALLRELLGAGVEIPVLASRAPRFPPGTVGSLAHDRHVAVAAVAPTSVTPALGIDVEAVGPLSEAESATVRRPEESAIDARLVFVLKEATYKAWSTTNRGVLDFTDVTTQVDGDRFRAVVRAPGQPPTSLQGRWAESGSRYLALAAA